MDPLQFAHRAGRGADDAKIYIMDTIHKNLEHHTLQPGPCLQISPLPILDEKLSTHFHLDNACITDFLIKRSQRVPVNNIFSPQGYVLSPLPSVLYTDDCRSTRPDSHLVKYEDDTVLLSLLSGSPHPHRLLLHEFVEWCDNSSLELKRKRWW